MANHTSPIDVIILASDGYYAMVRSFSDVFSKTSSPRLLRAGKLLELSQGSCLQDTHV